MIVERFLQAANTRDLETMSRLFGGEKGSFQETRRREQVELQMDAIAGILLHDDYEIVSESRVPGVEFPSNRIGVNLLLPGGRTLVPDVGFTVLLESPNRWLVNVIELTKITEIENVGNRSN